MAASGFVRLKHPRGAFETLAAAGLSEANLELWDDLLAALSYGEEATKALREDLAVKSLGGLEAMTKKASSRLARTLIDVLSSAPRREFANVEHWCDRLWETVNYSSIGRLAQVHLQEIDYTRETIGPHLARQLQRIGSMAAHPASAEVLSVRSSFAH